MAEDPELAAAKERGWREIAAIDAALAVGEIDEKEWHRRVLDLVEPAYLTATTPQGGSGHSGDAARWEHARRLVLDAVDRDGSFLDVGCANGLLMESVHAWAVEDGHAVEPAGVEISPRLAELARRRLPHWADRIHTANALAFSPPTRYTFVRTGLDYVPARRRADLVAHLLDHVVAPGGRLIIGAFGEERDDDRTERLLAEWGHRVAGRTSRSHRHPLLDYKVVWVDAAAV